MLLLALLLQAAPPADPGAIHHGRRGEVEVRPPRLLAEVVVDGRLDEPAWREAARLTGFSQYEPVDGLPAQDSTEVLLWYSPDAIHFGVRAFAPPGTVNATLADRDRLDSEDQVQILLDTFRDGRRAFAFGVNPLGVQSDGIRAEGSGSSRTGFSDLDLSPDFVYDSRGRLTDDGFEVEIRIPYESLRFQPRRTQDWGIQVVRVVQRTGHELTWTPARRASASFLRQSGTLRGLTGLRQGLVLDLNPLATTRVDGGPGADGRWEYDTHPELGANVRWGVTPNFTLNATLNPDFSQVEADVGQVPDDPRFALFFPERRPFFVEGSEYFNVPSDLIYSRRIAAPAAAAKLLGKVGATDVGLLSAVDDPAVSRTGDDHPVFNVLRLRRDLGVSSNAGLVYTDRIDGSDFNRVAGGDLTLVFGGMYQLDAQAVQSFTRLDGRDASGPLWMAALDRTGRNYGFHYEVQGIDPGFRTASGFVRRTGIVDAGAHNRFTFFGGRGALIENWTSRVSLSSTSEYDGVLRESPLEARLQIGNDVRLRGGWSVGFSPTLERVRFEPAFFADYASADGTAFALPDPVTSFRVGGSVATPQFPRFSARVDYTAGRDVNYFEAGAGRLSSFTAEGDWRPTGRIRVNGRYVFQERTRRRDGSTFYEAHIPRLKLEYQLSRPLFLRLVGQYESLLQDALLHPASGDPLLRRAGDGGILLPVEGEARSGLAVDWLLSYRPGPGTVLFLGYGSTLAEPDALALSGLRRTRDGLFFKVSYLFRL